MSAKKQKKTVHALFVHFTLFSIFSFNGAIFRADAGEHIHPYYCMIRALNPESDWGRIVSSDKNDPINGEYETICPDPCYPDCVNPTVLGEYCYTGFCPESLPAPGHGVHLAMVSGAWQVKYGGWEIDIGFGDRRPLNLFSRAWRSPDLKKARVFLPSKGLLRNNYSNLMWKHLCYRHGKT